MWKALTGRIKQKYRTTAFPCQEPVLPERFHGKPVIGSTFKENSTELLSVCPTQALKIDTQGQMTLDMGRCLFCGACQKKSTDQQITFSRDYRLATRCRSDLVVTGGASSFAKAPYDDERIAKMEAMAKKMFKRSFKLRQVSAGGCGACEADTNVLGTLVFDLGRFGIQFVASPRHADGLLITGPVTQNMRLALQKTYEAMPTPKIVIAVGACAISGGPYQGNDEVIGGADKIVPVDLYVPGCPPHPYTILDGILRCVGKARH